MNRITFCLLLPVAALSIAWTLFSALPVTAADDPAGKPRIDLVQDGAKGQLQVMIDGKEAFVYQHGQDQDLAHYYPVRSPSGKSMTVQKTEPFPHHRSFWFGDRVRLAGQKRDASFYAPLYSQVDKKDPKSPFRDRVRHLEFVPGKVTNDRAEIGMKLVWEMDLNTPVIDEDRKMRVVALGDGQYFLDVTFTVTAAHGDVTFTSDWVHYAWPYIRMNKEFSVQGGGTIISSEGGKNQKETNGKPADWIDYYNTVEGKTEGLALCSHPDNPRPHKWLTRDYGCFGPRRIDAKSGTKFTLEKGESLVRRIGVLVHRGDSKAA
ncbi:MAG TPA: DUF6807 family protein, partial [Phycisphaerae bacterium]|nr:DUF6807 family protein [Phycisphaerae bacterium]